MWPDGLLLCTEHIPNEMWVVRATQDTYDHMITEKYKRNEAYNKNRIAKKNNNKTRLTSPLSCVIIEPIRDSWVIKWDRRTYNCTSTGK